jgi:hypothetical protein
MGRPQNQGPDAGWKPFEAPFGKLRAGRTGRRYEKETADPRQNRPGRQSALGAAALVMTARENPQGPRRNARRSTLGYK